MIKQYDGEEKLCCLEFFFGFIFFYMVIDLNRLKQEDTRPETN